jgi:hypothetical protein
MRACWPPSYLQLHSQPICSFQASTPLLSAHPLQSTTPATCLGCGFLAPNTATPNAMRSTTLRLPTILCVNSIVFSLVSILTLLFGGDLSHSVVGILVLQGITLLGHAFTLLPRASSQWASGKGTNPEMRRNGMTSTELWHFGSAVLLFMAVIAAVTTPNSQWLARRGSTITGVTFTFLTA